METTANLVEVLNQWGRDVELAIDCNCPVCHANHIYQIYCEDYMEYSFDEAYVKGGGYELTCPYCLTKYTAAYLD